jgi:hypothetical protein
MKAGSGVFMINFGSDKTPVAESKLATAIPISGAAA